MLPPGPPDPPCLLALQLPEAQQTSGALLDVQAFLGTCTDEELRHMRTLAHLCAQTYYMGQLTVRTALLCKNLNYKYALSSNGAAYPAAVGLAVCSSDAWMRGSECWACTGWFNCIAHRFLYIEGVYVCFLTLVSVLLPTLLLPTAFQATTLAQHGAGVYFFVLRAPGV